LTTAQLNELKEERGAVLLEAVCRSVDTEAIKRDRDALNFEVGNR
jgi:hypothetical protein